MFINYFSKDVTEYKREHEPLLRELCYKLFSEKREAKINPLLDPTPEDIKVVLANVEAIKNYCMDSARVVDGIVYLNISLGGIRAESIAKKVPRDIAHEILIAYRRHWIETRRLDPAPFITLLTPRAMQLAVPVSIQGYRTLADIQAAQRSVQAKMLADQAADESRKAKALQKCKHL